MTTTTTLTINSTNYDLVDNLFEIEIHTSGELVETVGTISKAIETIKGWKRNVRTRKVSGIGAWRTPRNLSYN